GIWLGMDIVMGILVFAALADSTMAVGYYQGLAEFAVWPLLTVGVLCLASGVLLGLGSKYGLVRYWWVAVKLVLNVVLCVLVLFLLRPGVLDAAAGIPEDKLFMPPIVSTTAVLFATIISVYKPWGRVRKRTYAPAPEARTPSMAGTR